MLFLKKCFKCLLGWIIKTSLWFSQNCFLCGQQFFYVGNSFNSFSMWTTVLMCGWQFLTWRILHPQQLFLSSLRPKNNSRPLYQVKAFQNINYNVQKYKWIKLTMLNAQFIGRLHSKTYDEQSVLLPLYTRTKHTIFWTKHTTNIILICSNKILFNYYFVI